MTNRAKSNIALSLTLVLMGCSTGAVVTEPPGKQSTPAATSVVSPSTGQVAGDVIPVSISNPGPEAAEAFEKCQIGKAGAGLPITFDMVTGMGKLASGTEVLRFVPLTGREPQLAVPGPIWVVQIKGDTPQRGGEIWTDPTCVVTAELSGWFATGPVTTPTGNVVLPEAPAEQPTEVLPPLGP